MFRHNDFERIYQEFTKYYKDIEKGKFEYYDWINALQLDETKPYGASGLSRESFVVEQLVKEAVERKRNHGDKKMKIRIVESQQWKGILGYLNTVVKSKEEIEEYFGVHRGHALTYLEANDYARLHYGLTWRFDPTLGLCIDGRQEELNRNMRVEGDTLTVNVKSLIADEFRGTWGTDIDADSKIDMQSDNAKTVIGTDVSQPMKSGYDAEKRIIRIWV